MEFHDFPSARSKTKLVCGAEDWMRRTLILVSLAIFVGQGVSELCAWAHLGTGIVVDSEGRVYIADTIRNCVWRIDGPGKVMLLARDVHTNGLALDQEGTVYVVEGSVRRITPEGKLVAVFGTTDAAGDVSGAIGMDRDLNIWLLSAGRQGNRQYQVFRRTTDGVISLLAGGERGFADGRGVEAKLSIVSFATCSPDGSLYLKDGNHIRRIAWDGTVSTVTEAENATFIGDDVEDLQRPLGLAVDAPGNIYVAHYWKRTVFKITPRGEVSELAQTRWPWIPTGVAVGGNDVYLLERFGNPYDISGLLSPPFLADLVGNPRVRKVPADGCVAVYARVRNGRPETDIVILLAGIVLLLLLPGLILRHLRRRSRVQSRATTST